MTHHQSALTTLIGEVLNDQFCRLIRGEKTLAPTLQDALAAARAIRNIRRSQQEGRRIVC